MLEKFIEIVEKTWDRLCPVEVIDIYNNGGVLRFGKYHRTLEPGFHLKWPLAEHVVSVLVCETTQRIGPQTLTTKDGVGVVASAIIRYQIEKIEPYITMIWDQADVLVDCSMGAVLQAVSETDYSELIATPPVKRVQDLVRSKVNRYGFKIHAITFTDIGRARTYRLISQSPKDMAN